MTQLLEDGAALEKVATGTIWAEGPVWIPARSAVRYSDIPNNRIVEYSEATGALSVYREDVEFTNGRALDLDGAVVQCSHGWRAVERETDDSVETLVDRFGTARLNSPNDVVVKSDGTIWFTDPAYGILRGSEGHTGELEYGDQYVFRFDPRDGSLRPVVMDVEAPNGLAFSPDESVLYVADSSLDPPRLPADPDDPRGHALHAYDVLDGRLCKNGRTFAEIDPGVPDGIRVDEHGNVWTSSLDSVQVYSPDGVRLACVAVPEKVGNLCFGGAEGRTLYVVASTSLYRVRTTVRDAAAVLRAAGQRSVGL